jgi:predicted TIM-barrel fold metal-dependent hydrolase
MANAVVDDAFESGLLPDPEARPVRYTVISVDDHLVEPAHMFEGRLPERLQERAPRVLWTPEGRQVWDFDGERFPEVALNANAGRRFTKPGDEPGRYDQIRPGCYDVDARVADMDLNGVWASMSFPSRITGFCGTVYSKCPDRELGLATLRAWNDWLYEEWYSPYPDRIIPLGVTYLTDPELAAAEIRRNAARGFRAVGMPERPQHIGLPSLFSGYWDPIIEACVETDTVLSLHAGNSGTYDLGELPESGNYASDGLALGMLSVRGEVGLALFPQLALCACVEWLFSGYPDRYPTLKISLAEGGIGWVAMLLDRLDQMIDRRGVKQRFRDRPSEIVQRNFWFCTIEDPSTIDTRYRIGVENICLEVDYPHQDSTWPDTQLVIEENLGHLPVEEIRAICCENAAALFRHPLPAEVLPR